MDREGRGGNLIINILEDIYRLTIMKVLALLALAACMVDQDMLVHADEVADDNIVPSDEQPLADTEGVGCSHYDYTYPGSLCDLAYCGSGYSSYNNCKCQSGTCSYSGYCTSENYYYDFYNECYSYVVRGVGYNDATDLVWLWWVISIVTTLIIVAVIITIVCCIRKKRR